MLLPLLSAVALATAPLAATPAPAPAHHAHRATHVVRTLTVTARDYAFDAPDSVIAGRTLVRLVNAGHELHHAYLMRLDAGRTFADLAAAFKGGGPLPAWAHDAGGPNAPAPGATSAAVVTLDPGSYVLLCVIPAADGMPHVMKGMARTITVVPSPTFVPVARTNATKATLTTVAAADVRLTLKDYGFVFSRPLTAGRHVVRVTNDAAQSHEIFLARLAPGKKVQDLLAWVQTMKGPPPAEPMGGAAPLARGQSNDVVLDLEPGEYGLYCFVPDAKDRKPHVMHGMARQITIR